MSDIVPFEDWEVFTKPDGTPDERAREFLQDLTNHVNQSTVLFGTGSPEGVLSASPTAQYMDDTGTAGNILYVKKTGTGNTGWILV